ncbi:hypothetical protein B0H13DRAFT_1865765 [Mycena leptocephala]|nr:hypothetical protein B0H13DRAFT_1865765 [Mycena leptocephala]
MTIRVKSRENPDDTSRTRSDVSLEWIDMIRFEMERGYAWEVNKEFKFKALSEQIQSVGEFRYSMRINRAGIFFLGIGGLQVGIGTANQTVKGVRPRTLCELARVFMVQCVPSYACMIWQ